MLLIALRILEGLRFREMNEKVIREIEETEDEIIITEYDDDDDDIGIDTDGAMCCLVILFPWLLPLWGIGKVVNSIDGG